MIKQILTLLIFGSQSGWASSYGDYVRAGLPDRLKCQTTLAAVGDVKPHPLAVDLMLSTPATRDFFQRLRPALDSVQADGVIIAGARRHQLFADDWLLELRVILADDERSSFESSLRATREFLREDLIEGSTFMRHFGARAFLNAHGTYVTASDSSLVPDSVPDVAGLLKARARLVSDLTELERVSGPDQLASENVFAHLKSCASFAPGTPEFARQCLPAAVKRAFESLPYGLNFAAAADTIVILRSGAAGAPAWFEALHQRGYRRIYSLGKNGVPRPLTQMPSPPRPERPIGKPKSTGSTYAAKRGGRQSPRSPVPTAPGLRAKR